MQVSNCEGLRERGRFDFEMEKFELCRVFNFARRIQNCGPLVVGLYGSFDFGLGLTEVGWESEGGGQAVVGPFLPSYGPNKRQSYGFVVRQSMGCVEEPTLKKDSLGLKDWCFGFALTEKEGETGSIAALVDLALLEASRFLGTSFGLGFLLGLRDSSSFS